MPRFVVLEHDHPTCHWDLMLEAGPVLRTWRLSEPPIPGKSVGAKASFEHRLHYLDYEGPVSGGRGNVKRWLAGTFEWLQQSTDVIEIDYQADGGRGRLSITRVKNDEWLVHVASVPK
jgi:DNA polymerase ligase (LigD)-like protein